MMPVTNSLRVTFPESEAPLSMAPVCRELSRFGEVARLEMPPDGQLSAVVSYYDVRAATRAREGLGDRCTLEPEYGDRIVVSHGDVQVSAWMIQEIRTVQREGSGGKYTLEFFDTRAAERAASCLFAHAGLAQCPQRLQKSRPTSIAAFPSRATGMTSVCLGDVGGLDERPRSTHDTTIALLAAPSLHGADVPGTAGPSRVVKGGGQRPGLPGRWKMPWQRACQRGGLPGCHCGGEVLPRPAVGEIFASCSELRSSAGCRGGPNRMRDTWNCRKVPVKADFFPGFRFHYQEVLEERSPEVFRPKMAWIACAMNAGQRWPWSYRGLTARGERPRPGRPKKPACEEASGRMSPPL
eukprot:CAMPEP_0179176804 /NCGR_PEP_ID=MMETSP0796-20121207/87427_1 /TAXON_ID=73915 /ORGANISM="Pyrodinium bahamense, Strain pbaha01" /LENGTH=352 /DNA_ID=CAMNT_0020880343 /DNA_START=124 /DNA_END=1180 /DNA_ORIENTATION=+